MCNFLPCLSMGSREIQLISKYIRILFQ
jgi:hypothetical protein